MNPSRPINESVQIAIDQSKRRQPFNRRLATEHLIALFALAIAEGDQEDERDKIAALIKADKWDRDAQAFYDSISSSTHHLALTPYTVKDYEKMDTYKLPGYDIGFALKDHDGSEAGGSGHKGRVEIVAVHNNSGIKGLGQEIMQAAIKHGGRVLDHFDGPLSNIYGKAGFETYKEDPYNPDYDPNGSFRNRYGKMSVHYRRYVGDKAK
jgi:hypothetical protein